MLRGLVHLAVVVVLTLLTQIGGLAWVLALAFRRRWLAFPAFYAALWMAASLGAPALGRVPLPCAGGGPLVPQTVLTCALNRHYVVPGLQDVAIRGAARIAAETGRPTRYLDAGFPFAGSLALMPMLPHLGHRDGRALDLAFWYRGGPPPSPIGYVAFVDGPALCPATALRWDFDALQGFFPARALDGPVTAAGISAFAGDPRVRRIFLEPHLKAGLGLTSSKIRFQGCGAARHDDHFHVELAPLPVAS